MKHWNARAPICTTWSRALRPPAWVGAPICPRWTNQQMLWHLAFGYLVVSPLLRLVRPFGRLPDPFSRAFAPLLNAATRGAPGDSTGRRWP